MLEKITKFSMKHPWWVIAISLVITGLFLMQFPKMRIDTDPENMLQESQPDRAYYDMIKEEFDIDDYVMIGIVDEESMFRPEALREIAIIIDEIKNIDLTYQQKAEDGTTEEIPAITVADIISITTSKNLFSTGDAIDPRYILPQDFFDMPENDAEMQQAVDDLRTYLQAHDITEPTTPEELLNARGNKILSEIHRTPYLQGLVTSTDGNAIAIYVPIVDKSMGYPVVREIERIVQDNLLPGQEWHAAGLPIAEETFGHEMFIQMAVVAPAAFLLIMLIIWLIFRQTSFLLPVAVVSALSVTWSMGLLIGMGFTVHIMSSMIPVFLLPIAILDTVHILSVFFDRFRETGKRDESILWSMQRLYAPMFFTSVTSAVGFASLAMADIPPVQVFGAFVAFGIFIAWAFTVTLVPAMMTLLKESKLKESMHIEDEEERVTLLDKVLAPMRVLTYRYATPVLIATMALVALGVWGILQIQVNDNPVKWFKEGHPIREADEVFNREFGGTYLANLIIEGEDPPANDQAYAEALRTADYPNMLNKPEVSVWIDNLKEFMADSDLVGKVTSTFDAVKRIHYVFVGDAQDHLTDEQQFEQYYVVPTADNITINEDIKYALFEEKVINQMSDEEYDEFFDTYDYIEDSPQYAAFEVTPEMAEQYRRKAAFELINWSVGQLDNDRVTQNDLKKFLKREQRTLETSDGSQIENVWEKVNIWIQMKSGDNQHMQAVEELLAGYLKENPAPEGINITWTGLTYVNKVWQDLMVNGMLWAVFGSFVIVFILMLVEFRDLWLGLMAMIPLTVALLMSYGLMGWIGKDYDMPIAVCSSLSLGLAVDFAIHFLQRYKRHYQESGGDLAETHEHMFGEPGRAIMRNAIVISLGFLPLLVSSLTPYTTVGSFFSLLMVMATMATMLVLPAGMRYLAPIVFKKFRTQEN